MDALVVACVADLDFEIAQPIQPHLPDRPSHRRRRFRRDNSAVTRALQAGARAYLLKSLVHKELLDTIRAVHAGKKTLSPDVSYQLAEHATDDALTKGEIDVLQLIAGGNANKQIADRLSITEDTVKGRVKNILSKLGADDRTHAAMIGLKRGIIEL